jgi:hypothetical protein
MGKVLAFTTNIRLGWNWFTNENSLGYSTVLLITNIKSFVVQALERFNRFYHFYPHINTMGNLIALPTNIGLGWNWFANENSLGYSTVL